jgi:hypothetical protein
MLRPSTISADTGGLIAFDRGDRQVAVLMEAARRRRDPVLTSSGCVAQAWRGDGSRQALMARLLQGTAEVGIDRWYHGASVTSARRPKRPMSSMPT